MKWTTKPPFKWTDRRTVRKFCFLPTQAADGKTYWLQYVWVYQRSFQNYPIPFCAYTTVRWRDVIVHGENKPAPKDKDVERVRCPQCNR